MGHSDKLMDLQEALMVPMGDEQEAVPVAAESGTRRWRIRGYIDFQTDDEEHGDGIQIAAEVAEVLRERGVMVEVYNDDGDEIDRYATFFAEGEVEEATR